MMKRLLLSGLMAAVLGLVCIAFISCEEEDPAMALVKQGSAPPAGQATDTTPPDAGGAPAVAADAGDAMAADEAGSGDSGAESAEGTDAGAATPEGAEGEEAPAPEVTADSGSGSEAAEAGDDSAADTAGDQVTDEEIAEAVDQAADAVADVLGEDIGEMMGEELSDALGELAGQAGEESGEMVDEGRELTDEEKIENFRNLDPREIILAKYDDLRQQQTAPWIEDDPKEHIPQTGRVDPMAIVDDAVPAELRPQRTGETDQNEIDTYFIVAECTAAVRALGSALEVYNVIEIGPEKFATISVGGRRFTVRAGQGTSQVWSVYGTIPIVAGFSVSYISTSQVMVSISASGQGTTTSVSENKVFIPKI